ncbi:MAG: branched-chain amino acid ABC transporter permease [Bacteroidota bacterium]
MLTYILLGLTIGAIYALIAVGFSLIFETVKLLHFAQGDLLMIGGFIALSLIAVFGFNPIVVGIGTMLALGLFAAFLQRIVYNSVPAHLVPVRIMSTLGIGMALRNAASLIWGAKAHNMPEEFFPGGPVNLIGLTIRPGYYWTLIVSLVVMALLLWFLYRTKIGLATRTVAYRYDIAEMLGVNPLLLCTLSFGIAGALAGISGILVSPQTFVHFHMGPALNQKGFTAAVLGGLGSIPGGILGGFTLGLIETFGGILIPSGYQDVISFVILVCVLFIRPQGLLGQVHREKL